MAEVSLTELHRIMESSAGGDGDGPLPDNFAAAKFGELGYDSLALLETTNRIERTYGLTIPEEGVEGISTPGELLALVNNQLQESA